MRWDDRSAATRDQSWALRNSWLIYFSLSFKHLLGVVGCSSMHPGSMFRRPVSSRVSSRNIFTEPLIFPKPDPVSCSTSWFELKFRVWIKCNTKQSRTGTTGGHWWSLVRRNETHIWSQVFVVSSFPFPPPIVFPVNFEVVAPAAAGAGVNWCSLPWPCLGPDNLHE